MSSDKDEGNEREDYLEDVSLTSKGGNLRKVTVRVPENLLEDFDRVIDGTFESRSDALRASMLERVVSDMDRCPWTEEISESICKELQILKMKGAHMNMVASGYPWDYSTIRYHANAKCEHGEQLDID